MHRRDAMYRFALFLILLACPALAHAGDIVATYHYQDGSTVVMSTRDAAHVRMDTGPDHYMLLKDNKVYAVSKSDGQWQYMDMDRMAGMGSMFGQSATADVENMDVRYTKTSRREKIAGYTGTVYEAEVTDKGKLVRRDEVVMSTHSDIKRANQGWMALAERMSQSMGQESAQALKAVCDDAVAKGYGGVLRYGDEMRLVSLKKASLDASSYDLPSGSHAVNMGQPAQQGNTVNQDAEDIGQAAHDEAKDAAIDEVRQGVRDVFNGLFN